MNTSSSFDASSSALGYIYQIRYALLLALQKIDVVDDPDDCLVSIEKIDDISFHSDGTPDELLQTKYHATPGNLTDRSADIWKTVRVWSEFLRTHPDAEDVTFTLVTTQAVASNSLASWLLPDSARRDVGTALARMQEICEEKSSATNLSSYKAFRALPAQQQRKLVSSIYVLESAQSIPDVTQDLKKKLRTTVGSQHIDSFLMRLEGAWFKAAIKLLESTQFAAMSLSELVSIIDDLRTQFLPGNLPADYDEAQPDAIDVDGDERTFVEQLRLIGASNLTIRLAIINYYRACEQRSRWSRENLLKPGEIQKYLNLLREEWEHYVSHHELTTVVADEDDGCNLGRAIYASCQSAGAIPIRQNFEPKYVARGSYHELADKRDIGWHPEYEAKLSNLNKGAA